MDYIVETKNDLHLISFLKLNLNNGSEFSDGMMLKNSLYSDCESGKSLIDYHLSLIAKNEGLDHDKIENIMSLLEEVSQYNPKELIINSYFKNIFTSIISDEAAIDEVKFTRRCFLLGLLMIYTKCYVKFTQDLSHMNAIDNFNATFRNSCDHSKVVECKTRFSFFIKFLSLIISNSESDFLNNFSNEITKIEDVYKRISNINGSPSNFLVNSLSDFFFILLYAAIKMENKIIINEILKYNECFKKVHKFPTNMKVTETHNYTALLLLQNNWNFADSKFPNNWVNETTLNQFLDTKISRHYENFIFDLTFLRSYDTKTEKNEECETEFETYKKLEYFFKNKNFCRSFEHPVMRLAAKSVEAYYIEIKINSYLLFLWFSMIFVGISIWFNFSLIQIADGKILFDCFNGYTYYVISSILFILGIIRMISITWLLFTKCSVFEKNSYFKKLSSLTFIVLIISSLLDALLVFKICSQFLNNLKAISIFTSVFVTSFLLFLEIDRFHIFWNTPFSTRVQYLFTLAKFCAFIFLIFLPIILVFSYIGSLYNNIFGFETLSDFSNIFMKIFKKNSSDPRFLKEVIVFFIITVLIFVILAYINNSVTAHFSKFHEKLQKNVFLLQKSRISELIESAKNAQNYFRNNSKRKLSSNSWIIRFLHKELYFSVKEYFKRNIIYEYMMVIPEVKEMLDRVDYVNERKLNNAINKNMYIRAYDPIDSIEGSFDYWLFKNQLNFLFWYSILYCVFYIFLIPEEHDKKLYSNCRNESISNPEMSQYFNHTLCENVLKNITRKITLN